MKKLIAKWKTFTVWFRAFLILSVAFLAVGLASLGTATSAGKAYGLWTKGEGDVSEPAIVFRLSNLTEKKGNSNVTVELAVKRVFVNVAAIYGQPGEVATLRLGRGYSATSSFSTYTDGTIENFYAAEGTSNAPGALYNWVEPFAEKIPAAGWRVSTYRCFKLTSRTHNVLINEVVFLGEILDENREGTGKMCVIPAEIDAGDATLLPIEQEEGESREQARARALKEAGALLDAQIRPSASQSSFFRFSQEEVYSLMTIREMRTGTRYDNRNVGLYRGDTVYGALGNDILALGTLIFGMSPFGLRFFPMLASFGVLIFGYMLAKRLGKTEKAGFLFAVLYALGNFAFGFGHLGTPLMLGLFFFTASLDLMHRFYWRGMKKANAASAVPVALSGLFAACAILVNGAWLIPAAGIVALFVLGMVRQRRAKQYYLDKAIAEAETESVAPMSEDEGVNTPSKAERKVARVAREYAFRERIAPTLFAAFFLIGGLLLSVLAMLPASPAYIKIFDDPSAPKIGFFGLIWETFKGGYTGRNVTAYGGSGWAFFYELFRGTGSVYAVTGIVFNVVGMLACVFGAVFAVYRIVRILSAGKPAREQRGELRALAVPLVGCLLTLIPSFFGAGAVAFRGAASVFGFILFAMAHRHFSESGDAVAAKAARIAVIVGLCLLVVFFLLTAFFTFSIPLPGSFMGKLFG